jgi:hypothetical protein
VGPGLCLKTALHPTWKDAPAVALGIIKGFAAYPPPVPDVESAWKTARDEILQHPLMRFGPLRSAFLKILAEARTLIQIREDTHFYATMSLPIFRRTSLELGRRLVPAALYKSLLDTAVPAGCGGSCRQRQPGLARGDCGARVWDSGGDGHDDSHANPARWRVDSCGWQSRHGLSREPAGNRARWSTSGGLRPGLA